MDEVRRRRRHGDVLTSGPQAMEAYRVSRAVITPRSNAEALLEPV
ncbi:hypothetical protein [Stenotrophomonas sp. SrG]